MQAIAMQLKFLLTTVYVQVSLQSVCTGRAHRQSARASEGTRTTFRKSNVQAQTNNNNNNNKKTVNEASQGGPERAHLFRLRNTIKIQSTKIKEIK